MKLTTIIAAGVLVSCSASALAQQPPAAGGQWNKPMTRDRALKRADRMFDMIDSAHTGVITLAQAQQAASQMASMTGKDPAKLQARVARMFNGAPSLTRTQFEQQQLAKFDARDANHDGVLGPDERPAGQQPRQ